MTSDSSTRDGQVIPLLSGRSPIVLAQDGVDHPTQLRGRGRVFTRYSDITHFATSTHAAWIATKGSVYILGRAMFAQTGGPELLVQALARRIAEQPGGAAQLARMAEVERRAHRGVQLRAIWVLAAVCLAGYLAQVWIGPEIDAVANFTPHFFRDGDLWRVVTANLVHGGVLHLGINLLALVGIGALVERPLGATRTALVMGVSGVTAMLAAGIGGSLPVVGVSGVIFGLVAAAIWIEFAWAERLPALWRYPRRSLLILVGINGVIGFVIPMISGSAHLGGFLGGLAVMAVVARKPLDAAVSPRWVTAATATVVIITTVAVGSAAWELSLPGNYHARQAARLANVPDLSPDVLNDNAWIIAIAEDSTQAMLEDALVLAERAVRETERENPNILDTLAEVQFALGRSMQAVETIDEAIALAPGEAYFREQRRRFTGERDADDRPDAPLPAWMQPRGPEPPPRFEEPGLTV